VSTQSRDDDDDDEGMRVCVIRTVWPRCIWRPRRVTCTWSPSCYDEMLTSTPPPRY